MEVFNELVTPFANQMKVFPYWFTHLISFVVFFEYVLNHFHGIPDIVKLLSPMGNYSIISNNAVSKYNDLPCHLDNDMLILFG